MIKGSEGKGKRAYYIGREIGVSKNTAREYMTQLRGLKGGEKAPLDPYKPQLDICKGYSTM